MLPVTMVRRILMPKKHDAKLELLQGTLDMMVMRILLAGPANGYEIARSIERLSRGCSRYRPRISVSGALPPGEERNAYRQMGDLFHESPRAVLSPDSGGPKTACCRAVEMGTDGRGHRARDASRVVRRGQFKHFGMPGQSCSLSR